LPSATEPRPAIDRGGLKSEEIELSATARSVRLPETKSFNFIQTRGLRPLSLLIALALSGCGDKAQQQAAPPAPSVTVAQPTKRIVTDWDEFTGRFEAVEEVQVRARVGGFVTSVEFRDGAIVHAGDLLYVIDSRPFEAVALQADGQLSDARARANWQREPIALTLT
jgi:multidrug efflux pump subunit AcrA (membrane-fusion protein)